MHSRNILLLAVLAVAVIGLCALPAFAQGKQAAKQAGKLPVATVQTKSVNLGDVIEGQDIEYAFTVKNTGSAELQIISVRPG